MKSGTGLPDGAGGLGTESDAILGTDGQAHAFASSIAPNLATSALFGFVFAYPDGSSFYSGTVADDGSFGYGAIADGSGTKPIVDGSGKFLGTYTIYREGTTLLPAGTVTLNRYFSGMTGQSYAVDPGSGGGNGLTSETGFVTINGVQMPFGDPPELDLPASNPALAIPGVTTADPATALTQTYQQVLGRAPDSGGLSVYQAMLGGGAGLTEVRGAIAHSAEARNDINQIYRQVMGRDGDNGGIAAYANALGGGNTLANVRLMLAQSLEAQNDLNQVYRQALGRDGDNGGLATYSGMLANGGSLADVRATIGHSGEAQNDLQLIYRQVLGRDGDSGGLAAYQDALGSGRSLDGVRSDIAHSAEAQSDLARLFNGTLGRDPSAAELTGAESRLVQGGSLGELQHDLASSGSAGGFTAIATGNGDTTLSAAGGPTAFLFSDVAFGNDTVFGFDASQDAIVLSRSQLPDAPTVLAHASQTASGTLIATGSNQSILLNGVPLSSLHPNNFQFV